MLLTVAGGPGLPSIAKAEPEATPDRQVLKCYDEQRILYCEPEYLQELINQAGTTPTRIEIGNGTETLVTKTLVIPAGADIELVDTNIVGWNSSTKIIREDGDFTGSLIRVEKGGKLTLSDGTGNGEGIIIDSRAQYENVVTGSSFSPTIMVEGELVMNAGTITGARKMSSGGEGAVTVKGKDAKFILNDGKITDNQRKTGSQFGAANVALTKGATMVMNGGEISKGISEHSPYAYGEVGGIGVFDGAHLTINGGKITENTGWSGNINVIHWLNESNVKPGDDTSDTRSTVVFNDGEITKGKAAFAGGGINIFGNADVTMNGGIIDSNAAPNGGGVNAMDMYINGDPRTYQEIDSDGSRWAKQHFGEPKPEKWTEISPARFTMNGGSITNNSATRTGGGVNVISNAVQLNAGMIEGNSAHDQGGGVYVATKSYNAHFMDTLITDNQAAALGGGIWLCPTGSLIMHVTNGVAVFENEATKSSSPWHWGDDIAHDNYGSAHPAGLRIDPRMLGGGEPAFYKDGSVASEGTRFAPENPGKEQVFDGEARESDEDADYRTAIQNEGLKAVVDDAAKETAKSWAKLTIQKNTAPRGAGVGSNGGLTFGTPESTEVKVTKAWKDAEGKDLDADATVPVKVQLVGTVGGEQFNVGQPVELNADNGWTHTFTDLPKTKTVDGEQVEVAYSVQELPVEGFTTKVTGNAKDGFTITNTENPPTTTEVPVEKVWKDADGADLDAESTTPVKVQLVKTVDGKSTPVGEPIELNADNGWKHTFTNLPLTEKIDGKKLDIQYTVEELAVEGFTSKVTGNAKDGFTITNTEIPPTTPPTTPPSTPPTTPPSTPCL